MWSTYAFFGGQLILLVTTVAVAADILDSRRPRAGMQGKGAATRLLYWGTREGGKRAGNRHLYNDGQRAENT